MADNPLEELGKMFSEHLEGIDRRIVREVKAPADWMILRNKMFEKVQEQEKLHDEIAYLGKKFWTLVEDALGPGDYEVNDEKGVVYCYEPQTTYKLRVLRDKQRKSHKKVFHSKDEEGWQDDSDAF